MSCVGCGWCSCTAFDAPALLCFGVLVLSVAPFMATFCCLGQLIDSHVPRLFGPPVWELVSWEKV